eukprot:5950081-Amphidinium_carterae.1
MQASPPPQKTKVYISQTSCSNQPGKGRSRSPSINRSRCIFLAMTSHLCSRSFPGTGFGRKLSQMTQISMLAQPRPLPSAGTEGHHD